MILSGKGVRTTAGLKVKCDPFGQVQSPSKAKRAFSSTAPVAPKQRNQDQKLLFGLIYGGGSFLTQFSFVHVFFAWIALTQ